MRGFDIHLMSSITRAGRRREPCTGSRAVTPLPTVRQAGCPPCEAGRMGKIYDGIDDKLRAWIGKQSVFFVGTAPLSGDGHVNVSPKGMAGTFAVLGPHRVGYLDYFGSGIETVAHLRENGRIVVMCCAFTGPPKIVRLHGTGRALLRDDPEFAELRPNFPKDRDHG